MKEKLGKQILNNTIILSVFIFFIEIVVKINTHNNLIDYSVLRIVVSSIFFALFISLFLSLLKGKAQKIISTIITSLLTIYAWAEINLYTYVGFFMGIGNAEQGTKIIDYIKDYIAAAKWQSYLVLVPLILFLIYIWWLKGFLKRKKLEKTSYFIFKNNSIKRKILTIAISVVILLSLTGIYYGSLTVKFMQNKLQPVKNTTLILTSDNSNLSVSQFGVYVYGLFDVIIGAFDIEVSEDIIIVNNSENETVTDYTRHIDDSAWNYLIENETNKTYNNLNNYFINREITEKNEYTGIFEGKNLIVVLMESTNMIAINEEEYPTIYKLYNEGITFRNNYTPRNNCSTGNNEMTAMTSLFTINNTCTANKYKNNVYPEAIFNIFNNAGYATSSYHDYAEYYYNRRTIHPNMGSMKYYNVNDLGIKWSSVYEEWPSDVELVEKATPNFINEEHFMAFLTTVTPHQPYSTSSEYGDAHLEEFEIYDYSKAVKRYMSKLKELDASLELLLQKLEEAGKLENTVIALFCDHYPYGLTTSQINQVLDYDVTINKEVDRTPMIIYNSEVSAMQIEKYTTIIDLLPTLLNMFNLDYDPRLYLGKDIFSDNAGRAVFADGSWQDEKGYYSATSSKFKPIDELNTYTDEELIEINQEITNRQKMSALAIKKDYFNYLYKKMNDYYEKQKEELLKEQTTSQAVTQKESEE